MFIVQILRWTTSHLHTCCKKEVLKKPTPPKKSSQYPTSIPTQFPIIIIIICLDHHKIPPWFLLILFWGSQTISIHFLKPLGKMGSIIWGKKTSNFQQRHVLRLSHKTLIHQLYNNSNIFTIQEVEKSTEHDIKILCANKHLYVYKQ